MLNVNLLEKSFFKEKKEKLEDQILNGSCLSSHKGMVEKYSLTQYPSHHFRKCPKGVWRKN